DYFELLHILEFKKAERVKDCAEVLEYKVSYETGEKTLYRVWFCKSRLCPMCNWRRAMKHGIQSQKVVAEVIKQKPTEIGRASCRERASVAKVKEGVNRSRED